MKFRIEQFLFTLFLFWVRILPQSWVSSFGNFFGSFVYYIGLRKKVVMKNLEIAFGDELSLEKRKILCKKVFQNLGMVFFEFMLMRWIPQDKLKEYIQIDGLDVLDSAMAEDQGVVLAGGHFGHWELLSAGISTFGTPMHGYVGKQSNPLFDQTINQIRTKFGMIHISKSKSSPRLMMKSLKDKQLLGVLGDLNVPNDTLFVDFFGKKAAVGQGLATFAVKRKTPLVFAWNYRIAPLRYQGKIIRLDYELTGDREKDIQEMAQLIIHQLEKVIRENPEQYFWVNKRWKTRPSEAKDEQIY
ncbi:MAG: KDO2-lipid IV(A) lauroyltransferase [bacterium]|jgi:KDO2-lipid IV(A) lauroyltransferase